MIRMNVNVIKIFVLITLLSQLLTGCCKTNTQCEPIEPVISLIPSLRNIDCLPSAFDKLTDFELNQDFGKELRIAMVFAKEFDLYRAITSYKRSLILIPKKNISRVLQIEYSIIECYYLALKYQDVIDTFESSHLLDVKPTFEAFEQLLVMLYDSYLNLGLIEKASRLVHLMEKGCPETAKKLKGYLAINEANFNEIEKLDFVDSFLSEYRCEKKSVSKAKTLNAILPGAGYYYIGQKKSAVTSFIINSLFTAAAYQFFHRGYYAAGAITLSFEAGWYFGGINGAGLEAKEYNERLYENKAKSFMLKNRMFPILTFETSF